MWGKGEQRPGREKGGRVSQTSCLGIVTRGEGGLTQAPRPWRQGPWGSPGSVGSSLGWWPSRGWLPDGKSGELRGAALGPGHLAPPSLITCHAIPKVLGLAGEEPVLPIQPAACCGGTSTPAAAAVPSSSVASQQLLSVLSLMKDASLGNKTWAFRSFKSSKKVIS